MNFPTLSLRRLNVWPVLQRELREGARRPVNHRLRFLGAGVATLLLWVIMADSRRSQAETGVYLFGSLHTFLLVLIGLVAPALTADCIAREKREGTLGLLFMTPLSAEGIVAGKALAQGLRAFTLWMAVLPILAIPFMTGGLTWFDALTVLSLEFCATVLCLAAGLLASSLAKGRNTVFLLAFLLGAFFLFLFGVFFVAILAGLWQGFAALLKPNLLGNMLDGFSILFGFTNFGGLGGFNAMIKASPRFGQVWTWLCLAGPLVVLLFFYRVARFAARRIERSWQDKLPSVRRESLLRRYCTPVSRFRFRRKMQRTLDWNPIAWLQQYSWKARTSKWGLCLAVVMIECAVFCTSLDHDILLTPLMFALAGIYTFIGVGGFLEEKRNGALELLLITPVSVNKIIFGRAWGLWLQFLPAALVLAGFSLFSDGEDISEHGATECCLACVFLSLPIFATYAALRVKNLIAAAALTWLAVWLPFAFAAGFIEMFTDVEELSFFIVAPVFLLSYGGFTWLTCFLLRHSLSRRIYSF